jgi:hypothetical protein
MTDCSIAGEANPAPKRVPLQTVEQVLGLYREKYFDFNVRHFHEKLVAEHGIQSSHTWVKQALQGRDWWRADANEECIANAGRSGLCRACCCTSMASITAGFRTSVGTT